MQHAERVHQRSGHQVEHIFWAVAAFNRVEAASASPCHRQLGSRPLPKAGFGIIADADGQRASLPPQQQPYR